MSLKNMLKWRPLVRRVVLRALMFVTAVIVLCSMQITYEASVIEPVSANANECPFDLELNLTGIMNSSSKFARPLLGASSLRREETDNLTNSIFEALIEEKLLQSDARVLCVGERSASAVLALRHLGFFNAFGVEIFKLKFKDNYFDFVFSENLDEISVPSLLLMEMERVLRPGGTGAILVGRGGAHTVASTFLKSSVHVCSVGYFKLVVFEKKLESFASFEHFRLPSTCPSIENNKPFTKFIEPLSHKIPSYLPSSMNISSRNRIIYINLGAGEYAKTTVAKMSKSYCSNHHSSLEVFVIDHKPSILSLFAMDPGVNFVYHPALAGGDAAADVDPMEEEGFEFLRWFEETVGDEDFVVLMMKAKMVELNMLAELFESGAICRVDELFVSCSDGAEGGDCMNLLRSLRKSGVYVHQWLGD